MIIQWVSSLRFVIVKVINTKNGLKIYTTLTMYAILIFYICSKLVNTLLHYILITYLFHSRNNRLFSFQKRTRLPHLVPKIRLVLHPCQKCTIALKRSLPSLAQILLHQRMVKTMRRPGATSIWIILSFSLTKLW